MYYKPTPLFRTDVRKIAQSHSKGFESELAYVPYSVKFSEHNFHGFNSMLAKFCHVHAYMCTGLMNHNIYFALKILYHKNLALYHFLARRIINTDTRDHT